MVYLTTTYAPYYALSTRRRDYERAAIIQLHWDSLDQTRLYPDEDFIAEALRDQKLGASRDIKKRIRYIIRHIEDYRENWMLSLENLGNVCFKGTVPVNAITKIVLFEPRRNPRMTLSALDPTICLLNYGLFGRWYQAMTRWYMGEDIDPATFNFPDPENQNGFEVLFESERLRSLARPGGDGVASDREGFTD